MTTEEDFQAALDACPADWQTRLVFADWLEEQGDPRGPGYRALSGRIPLQQRDGCKWYFYDRDNDRYPESDLPEDWWRLIDGHEPEPLNDRVKGWGVKSFLSRCEAEDAAALAFAKLPAARQTELLNTKPSEVRS